MNPGTQHHFEIDRARRHLVTDGYVPGKCIGVINRNDGFLVIHFDDDRFIGQEEQFLTDPIVATVNLTTGLVTVSESL